MCTCVWVCVCAWACVFVCTCGSWRLTLGVILRVLSPLVFCCCFLDRFLTVFISLTDWWFSESVISTPYGITSVQPHACCLQNSNNKIHMGSGVSNLGNHAYIERSLSPDSSPQSLKALPLSREQDRRPSRVPALNRNVLFQRWNKLEPKEPGIRGKGSRLSRAGTGNWRANSREETEQTLERNQIFFPRFHQRWFVPQEDGASNPRRRV